MTELAEWIWQNADGRGDEYAVFTETINYTGGRVELQLSCAGDYAAYLNGELCAFGQYADYPHYKVYDRVDITEYFVQGTNVLKIVGWYIGFDSSTYVDAGAGIRYELTIDGTVVLYSEADRTMSSISREYVSHLFHKLTPQLGLTYRYDTRGKDAPASARPAVNVKGFGNAVIQRPIKKCVMRPLTRARLIDKEKRLYDLGAETCGLLSIKFSADDGSLVTVGYGEHIADGGVRHLIGGREFVVELIGNGHMTTFVGTFRRLGARYLQVFCDGNVQIEEIGLIEIAYPLTHVPYRADTPLRQQIYDTSVRTLELCMHEHYEDTPWREQSLYNMDSRNQMLCGYYAFGEFEFAATALNLMGQAQKPDGLLPLCFPAGTDYPIPFFSLMYIVQCNEYAAHSNDVAVLQKNEQVIFGIVEAFVNRIEENGLIAEFESGYWNFYEWSHNLDGSEQEKSYKHRYALPLNCFFLYALEHLAGICQKLGKCFVYESVRDQMRRAVYRTFYRQEKGCFCSFSDRECFDALSNALAVLTDCCEVQESRRICNEMINGAQMTETTLSMKIFEYDALLHTDPSFADVVLKSIDRDYGFMLENGATSFWETLKGESDFAGAGSLCHGWSAIPVYYYHKLIKSGNRK